MGLGIRKVGLCGFGETTKLSLLNFPIAGKGDCGKMEKSIGKHPGRLLYCSYKLQNKTKSRFLASSHK